METSVSAPTTSVMVFLTVMITQMRLIAVSILMLKERVPLLSDASGNFLYLLCQILSLKPLYSFQGNLSLHRFPEQEFQTQLKSIIDS